MNAGALTVAVDGRTLRVSNMDKVLYPETGTTKADVIDYYAAVAEVLLPRLARRPLTLRRYPSGVDGAGFYEKNLSRHAPDWVPTVRLATPGSVSGNSTMDFALIAERPALVWIANLAGLELHVPQWTVDEAGVRQAPNQVVFDLDPGPGTTVVQCCRVALGIRELLAADGLTAWPKTSGAKGLQLYVPVQPGEPGDTTAYARSVAGRLARADPEHVVATIARAARTGRVLVDWSQNEGSKTTVAAYSLRARPRPTVSTPLRWAEVENCTDPSRLAFDLTDVRERLAEHGDLLADLDAERFPLPSTAD